MCGCPKLTDMHSPQHYIQQNAHNHTHACRQIHTHKHTNVGRNRIAAAWGCGSVGYIHSFNIFRDEKIHKHAKKKVWHSINQVIPFDLKR